MIKAENEISLKYLFLQCIQDQLFDKNILHFVRYVDVY